MELIVLASFSVLVLVATLALSLPNLLTRGVDDNEVMFRQQHTQPDGTITYGDTTKTSARVILMLSTVGATIPLYRYLNEDHSWGAVLNQVIYSSIALVLMVIIVRGFANKFVHSSGSPIFGMHDANVAESRLKSGYFIAGGLTIAGTLSGEAPGKSWVEGALVINPLFTILGLGLVAITALALGYLKIFSIPVTRKDLPTEHTEYNEAGTEHTHSGVETTVYEKSTLIRAVREGNLAAANIASAFVAGLGAVMYRSIAGDFTGYLPGILAMLGAYLAGAALLVVTTVLADVFVLRKMTVMDVVRDDREAASQYIIGIVTVVSLGLIFMP
jgi:hypothetical protein